MHTVKMSNLERKETGDDIAAKNNNQRVSVIRWSGRESTMTCREKSGFKEDASLPAVKERSRVSSYSVAKPSQSNNYGCSFCNKSFKWYSHWKSHERIHTGEKPFKCEICGKSFARSDGLQCHKRTHITTEYLPGAEENGADTQSKAIACKYPPSNGSMERSKLFNCDQCNRSFLSSAGILKHLQVHKRATDFTCEVCHMRFQKKSTLEVHSRVHTGIKPYRCNICTKAFSVLGNLKRHLLIHTGERPYQCPHCSNNFNNPSHLTRHLKNKHTMEKLGKGSR